MNPIFVKVRNDQGEIYHSYDILWQLVALAGFDTCELDEVEPDSNKTYIFTPDNGNVKACCDRPHTAKYILWQLEIPGQVESHCPNYFDEMWLSDQYFYSIAGGNKKFVPMGGDIGLYKEPDPVKKWDFTTVAYLYGKRAEQVAGLVAQGYSMAPVGFGDIRDEAIARSRWGLCLHQHHVPALSPQRMTLFACRKLPIVLEKALPKPYEVVYLDEFVPNDYKELAETNFRRFTQELTFTKCVMEALV